MQTLLRRARRMLVVERAFLFTSAVVLACGLSFSLATFAALKAFFYDVPPVTRPHELLYLNSILKNGLVGGLNPPQVEVIAQLSPMFDGVVAHGRDTSLLDTGTGGQGALLGEMVSGNYFSVLGVSPLRGRVFTDQDDQPGAAPAVLISEGLWRSHFDGSSAVIGSIIRLPPTVVGVTSSPGVSYSIIGVLPKSFHGLLNSWERAQDRVPFQVRARDYICDQPDILTTWPLSVVARLRPGESVESAKGAVAGQLSALRSVARSRATWSLTIRETRLTSLPFDRAVRVSPERVRDAALILMAVLVAVVVVDLLGLVMARTLRRRMDVAVRVALGASKSRVACEVVREVMVVALMGGASAVLLAKGLLALLVASLPPDVTQDGFGGDRLAIPLTAGGVLFLAAVCVLIIALVSVVSVRWAWRVDVHNLLSNGASQQRSGLPVRVQRGVLVPLVLLTTVILTVAAVVVQDAARRARVDLGYQSHGVSTVSFRMRRPPGCQETALEAAKASDARQRLLSRLLSRLGDDQVHVAVATTPPTSSARAWVEIFAHSAAPGSHYFSAANAVSAHYFDVLKIPLLWGRSFRMADSTNGHAVAIVSESLAKVITSSASLASASVAFHEPDSTAPALPLEIIGVVGDTVALNDDNGTRLTVYVPVGQRGMPSVALSDSRWHGDSSPATALVDPRDPSLFVSAPIALDMVVSAALQSRLMAAIILSLVGGGALIFSAIGLYGLVTYSTTQRLREFAIRSAVGARPIAIARLIFREAATVAAVGVTCGVAAGVLVVSYISHFLIQLPSVTSLSVAAVGIVVAGTVFLAAMIPALMAAAVDPVAALRT